jgi:hypothetical protein
MTQRSQTRRFIQALVIGAAVCTPRLSAMIAPPEVKTSEKAHGSTLQQLAQQQGLELECDRLAESNSLSTSISGLCSLAANELHQIGFDGFIDDLLAWWESASQASPKAGHFRASFRANSFRY